MKSCNSVNLEMNTVIYKRKYIHVTKWNCTPVYQNLVYPQNMLQTSHQVFFFYVATLKTGLRTESKASQDLRSVPHTSQLCLQTIPPPHLFGILFPFVLLAIVKQGFAKLTRKAYISSRAWSCNPPASVFWKTGSTGLCHHAWLSTWLLKAKKKKNLLTFSTLYMHDNDQYWLAQGEVTLHVVANTYNLSTWEGVLEAGWMSHTQRKPGLRSETVSSKEARNTQQNTILKKKFKRA